jgi:bilin biosynthesis protein
MTQSNPLIDQRTPNQIETDTLLQMVTDRISLDTFDGDDQATIQRVISEGLGDTRGVVRLHAAQILGEIGEPTTRLLVQALRQDPNVTIRRAAAKSLALIEDPASVQPLLQAFLTDEDTVVHGSSVGALARIGNVAVPALLEIIADSDRSETTKGHAAWALAFIGNEAVEYLYPALNSESIDVRCAVVSAISHVAQEKGDLQACQVLVDALTDPAALIRNEAAVALSQVNYPPAIPHLVQATRDEDVDVRKAAVSSLGRVGDAGAIAPLQAALQDPAEVVRVLAKVALQQIENRLAAGDDF